MSSPGLVATQWSLVKSIAGVLRKAILISKLNKLLLLLLTVRQSET